MPKFTKEDYEEIVKSSQSIAEVCRKLGKKINGGNYFTIQRIIDKYDIDTSHFTGKGWCKGLTHSEKTAKIPLADILKENTNFKSHVLKNRLIASGLKEYKCEKCGCDGTWLGEPITLELHHINGNHFDNRLENLQILCPNCHSQTNSYRGKNNTKYQDIPNPQNRINRVCICECCGKEFSADRYRKYCSRKCYVTTQRSLVENNINKEELESKFTSAKSISDLAKMFNTSRTTIKKYLEKYNLYDRFKNEFASQSVHSKKVLQYDLDMNLIKEWGSLADATETLGIPSINKCVRLKKHSAGGFIWRYAD